MLVLAKRLLTIKELQSVAAKRMLTRLSLNCRLSVSIKVHAGSELVTD